MADTAYRVHLQVQCPQCGEVKKSRGIKGFRHCGRLHDMYANLTERGEQKYDKHKDKQRLQGDPKHSRNQTQNDESTQDESTQDNDNVQPSNVNKLDPDNVFTGNQQQQQQQSNTGDTMSETDTEPNDNEHDDDSSDDHKHHCNNCGTGFDRKLYRCRQCGKRFAWDRVEW